MQTAQTSGQTSEAMTLSSGATLLSGQYTIQSSLQSGGFGVTYIAINSLGRRVVLKECFPSDLCTRDGDVVLPQSLQFAGHFLALKKQFILEARQMAVLEHPNIVAVHQVFEENQTAYMALSEVKGVDLAALVEERTGPVSDELLRKVTVQCLDVFDFIHRKGVLHRDIAPDNLMVDDNGHLTLIDFGASRQTDATTETGLYAVKDGYSPPELYVTDARHSFATDVYALGATLHYLVTGTAPPDSISRLRALKYGQPDPYTCLAQSALPYGPEMLSAIDRALNVSQKRRFQSVAEWRSAIETKAPEGQGHGYADLEAEIRMMVQSTNAQMADDINAPVSQMDKAVQPERTEEKCVVDIFGNPIEDVDAWLASQEQEYPPENQGDGPEPSTRAQESHPTQQTSLLGSFVMRCLSRNSCQTDQMTKT